MTLPPNNTVWVPTIITADALCRKEFPEPRWAIPGIVPEGTTLLCGKPKMGKSWMALGFGLDVASGGVALGSIPVEAGDVLYLSLEDNERRLKKRIKKILPDGDIPARLHLTTEWPKVGEGCREYITFWLGEHPEARMIIIDTLKKIRQNRGGRDLYDADYEIGSSLQMLSHKHGVAFLIVHHLRKADAIDDPMDMISGSTGLTGSVDGSLVLVRTRGEADATLHISGRDIEDDAPLALKFDPATALWEKIGFAVDPDMTLERQKIMRVLRDANHPMTAKAIAAQIGGKYENIRQIIYRLEEAGDVTRSGGNKKDGYTFQIPHYNNNNNYNQDDKGADSEGSCNSCNDCNYLYTLHGGDRGTYRTDAQDLATAQAELTKRYGDRLASVIEQKPVND